MFLPYGTYHIIISLCVESFIHGRFISEHLKIQDTYNESLVLNSSYNKFPLFSKKKGSSVRISPMIQSILYFIADQPNRRQKGFYLKISSPFYWILFP